MMPDGPLAVLSDEDRATVARWLDVLGFEPAELDAVPGLRMTVDIVAVATVVRTLSPPMAREEAWAMAATMLRMRNPLRTWYRWQHRAACMADDTLSGAPAPAPNFDVCGSTTL
jgi:hypothetical protein